MKFYFYYHKLRESFFLLLCMLIFLLVGSFFLVLQVSAQDRNQWSTPRQIPGYSADSNPPILIADQNRTIHAFNSTSVGEARVVVYSQWTRNTGWTVPVDIILPPWKEETRVKGAHLGKDGRLHLIFFSGDEEQPGIFYSTALLTKADEALAWSKPELVGQDAESFPDEAAIVGDSDGNLFVLFSAKRPSTGLYAIQSIDGGSSWSEPVSVFQTYWNTLKPNAVQIIADSQDNLHAVWDVVDESGHSQGIYYSQKEAGSIDWSEAVPLSSESTGVPNTPSIFEYEEELLAIFHANGPGGITRFMRRSSDGGRSWSERIKLFEHVGSNGQAAFVVDSSNMMHLFFGNRITSVGGGEIHGMWHSIWEGNQWGNPKAIVSGPQVVDIDGNRGFDPSFANAAVSQGNTMLVSWQSDPAVGLNGVWFSYTTTSAPELTVIPLPTPESIDSIEITSSAGKEEVMPIATPTPMLVQESDSNAVTISAGNNAVNSVAIGLIPVIILILIVPAGYWLLRLSKKA